MILGLIGKKRSGKDTFASTLVAEKDFTRFAFADPLKNAALHLNPLIGLVPMPGRLYPWEPVRLRDYVESVGWESAKECFEVRRTLQELGLAMRQIEEDFWLDATMDRVFSHEGDAVITDVRFPNEADAIRHSGGTILRIVRPGQVHNDSHPSENALNDYVADVTIRNDSSLDALAEEARQFNWTS